jgi:hypothetical protein
MKSHFGSVNTPYRPGGWTVRQVVHHLADSHMNSYIRFKLALTEELPTIKTYEEAKWAELSDGANMPVGVSLQLLDSLHLRWVNIIHEYLLDFIRHDWHHTRQIRLS